MNKNYYTWRRSLYGAMLALGCSFLGMDCFAVDPCQMTSSMSSGKSASNGRYPIGNGFDCEMWAESQQGSASMQYTTSEGQFQFKANWNNPNDLLCRIGLFWDNGPKPSQLDGDLHCEYNYDYTGSGGGYHYIGIYGWTKTPNEVEYYIVENTFNGSTQQRDGLYWDARPENGGSDKGTYSMDGDTYRLLVGKRTGASISGNSTFTQVYAIRQTARKCGHVSVSAHMREWEKKGVTLGNIHDCKFLCEVGGGSGSFNLMYGNVWVGDSEYVIVPPEPEEPEEPYNGAIKIPGVLEAENYDKGGNNFGYYDTDSKNEGGEYRNDGVDIVKGGTKYAIGHTADGEWLKYTIDVKESDEYDIYGYVSNGNGKVKLNLTLDDKDLITLEGNKTSDWDTYETIKSSKAVSLSKGEHILKINIASNYCNVDYLEFVTKGSPQSSSDNTAEVFALYPNPCKDILSIELPDTDVTETVSVEFVNLLGTAVKIEDYTCQQLKAGINVSDLPKGIYVIRIQNDKNTLTKRIVKE